MNLYQAYVSAGEVAERALAEVDQAIAAIEGADELGSEPLLALRMLSLDLYRARARFIGERP